MGSSLSVVVSTLNGREQLLSCLDALHRELPTSSELIVVNGPSSDGTSGAVRNRDDVDVLVEISERTLNVSRNAGIEQTTGDAVAFLGDAYAVESGWYDAICGTIDHGADIVTGPIRGQRVAGESDRDSTQPPEQRTIRRRTVTPFSPENVVIDRTVLEALDGFDEYPRTADGVECAHRVAGLGFDVTWSDEMAVRNEVGTDGGAPDAAWGDRYRSRSYRLVKNYGLWPSVVGRLVCRALADGASGARGILSGEGTPTGWLGNGVRVLKGSARGLIDGLRSRYADRSTRRNPYGLSSRHDRAVQVYDRRS
ncbi:glycosyltransferase [Halobacteria archaeon AArc-curdl1]|uniref:Glycosyltransferase n=1 Tax=Natronosalvus hydrolyticus TaxID=2979988 RepID=A0AAP2Z4C3_9EURY|nr:glycosyltransferase [Halobacteria archaeon AArc-curdl1]